MRGALIELLRGSPTSDGKVTFAWKAAVGPAIERVTHVKLERKVLLVETASAQWSKEVMRSSSTILKRLQSLLGADTVDRIEVCRTGNIAARALSPDP
ncbi:MAG TPA: DciA family protein [Vicinamibacterales bacterium]|nr:DciA family protein [Vicinamibacterales bacterium]